MIASSSGRAPWDVVALIAAFAAVAGFVVGVRSASKGINRSESSTALHDSISAERDLELVRFNVWADSVLNLRGDSLAALLAAQAVRVRVRWRLDTLVHRDTIRDSVLVAGADVRAVLVSDSSCSVRSDSLAGELVQARYDADQCADELAKMPTTCNGWTAFGIGVGVGAAASAAACLVVR